MAAELGIGRNDSNLSHVSQHFCSIVLPVAQDCHTKLSTMPHVGIALLLVHMHVRLIPVQMCEIAKAHRQSDWACQSMVKLWMNTFRDQASSLLQPRFCSVHDLSDRKELKMQGCINGQVDC